MASALLRAAHVRKDRGPWVLDDTVSARLVTADQARPIEAVMSAWPAEVHAAVRLRHSVRTRLAEDIAVSGLAAGLDQYVLLGAGLDTFAWRNRYADRFSVWELDHPDTQAWKRAALAHAGLTEHNVRFEPIDLAATDLASLSTPSRAMWSWMGVTMYLPRAATEAVLRAIAAHRPGTTLALDFNLALTEPDEDTRAVLAATATALAAFDEPLTTSYTPTDADSLLREAGFTDVALWDADALRERYFPQRPDLPDHRASLVAVATV